ncbi:hypothetical protein EPUS_06470 [Endocarpon pusillum Z07020]|uniref:Rhodopsin domain-containing protein n=1 Tax=Endocarpon pusillum (strain Z07020 / HMAS-L-300199) TaxID=1263415 RepID=U1I1Q3_ENDPU|nr:uncharacterized protein EPUS_06470 [Endocarpon pusillum Z07020]ERF77190.1 hypothetical protein EPUS_06470 [Endocarpon pusillum Z07020]
MSLLGQLTPQQWQNAPASPPPPGVLSNFVDPPSHKPEIIALEGVFLSLMLMAVAVRIFVRLRVIKMWGWDDYTCIIAAVGALVHMTVYIQMFKVGFGRHLWDIPAAQLFSTRNRRILSANTIVYSFTIGFAKLSILLLYLRLFKVDRGLRLAICFGIAVIAMYYTAIGGAAIASIVKCVGFGRRSAGFCDYSAKPVVVMSTVMNVVTDFYILALPLPCVMRLKLSLRRRIGVLIVFGCGIVTCAASLTRMIVFFVHYADPDVLWMHGRNAQFIVVEINTAIIVGCASCFPPFFAQTRIMGSAIYHFLRSHIGPNSHGSTASYISSKKHPSKASIKTSRNDSCHDSRTDLKPGGFHELRDIGPANGLAHVQADSPTEVGKRSERSLV